MFMKCGGLFLSEIVVKINKHHQTYFNFIKIFAKFLEYFKYF